MYHLLTRHLMPYILPFRVKALGAVILSFALAAIGGAQVKLVKPIFDHGLSADATESEIWVLGLSLLGLGILNFPCRFYHFYWIRYICDRATCSLRLEIFKKLQKVPTSFFSQSKQGDLMAHITQDTIVFAQGFRAIIDLIREPLKAMVYLGIAIWADWQLALLVIGIAPFWVLIFSVSGKKVRNNQKVVQDEYGELTHNITEGLGAHKITKAFNLQGFMNKRFKKVQDRLFNAQMKTTVVEEIAHPLVELVGAIVFSGIIIFAYTRIRSGDVTIGDFVSFVAAIALFMDPIRKFSQANVKLSQARAAADRIFSLLSLPEERDQGEHMDFEFKDSISVKDLTFSYGEGNVIEGLNLEVKKGQKVALVGLSGSGKSTLINLLLGLYPIDQGEVQIDGISLNDIKLQTLRDLFGLVSQDIFLFHDSIKENLSLGREMSDEKISDALDVAYAGEFIEKLPSKSETIIGDRGTRLSGGQQQRLTIARAFLQEPPIYLFDEATSALDNESEKVVQKALERLGGDKTVIAVAHRLSTVQDFDRIFVLHEGKLVEQGTHDQLMHLGGEYKKLYELSQKA